ncbi:hypothetical protein H9L39_12372 [Fusarium oxysporum f. sp. albedinis]|nr:hypothetical protein H9L39_12372 [Fusarium oxysporum f. sp. albedinis]
MDSVPADGLDPVLSPTLPEGRTSTATSDICKYHLGHNISVWGGSHPDYHDHLYIRSPRERDMVEIGCSTFPTPVELAYILPFTSQAAAMGTIWASSRGIFRNRIQKHTADHLLGLGLITLLVSALLLPLSTLGYFRSQMTLQWVFFMVITTVAYRLPESSSNEPATTSASQIELTPMGGSCSMNEPPPESSPDLNERTSIRSRVALPPDSMRSVEHSSNKQDIDSSV